MCNVEIRGYCQYPVMMHSLVLALHSKELQSTVNQYEPCVIHMKSSKCNLMKLSSTDSYYLQITFKHVHHLYFILLDSKTHILEGIVRLMYGMDLHIEEEDIQECCQVASSLGLQMIAEQMIQKTSSIDTLNNMNSIIIEGNSNLLDFEDDIVLTSHSEELLANNTKTTICMNSYINQRTNFTDNTSKTTGDNEFESDCYIEITSYENTEPLTLEFDDNCTEMFSSNFEESTLIVDDAGKSQLISPSVIVTKNTNALRCGDCKLSFRKCSSLVKHILSLNHYTEQCSICSFKVIIIIAIIVVLIS